MGSGCTTACLEVVAAVVSAVLVVVTLIVVVFVVVVVVVVECGTESFGAAGGPLGIFFFNLMDFSRQVIPQQ